MPCLFEKQRKVGSLVYPCQQIPADEPRSYSWAQRAMPVVLLVLLLLPVIRERCRDLNAAPLVAVAS